MCCQGRAAECVAKGGPLNVCNWLCCFVWCAVAVGERHEGRHAKRAGALDDADWLWRQAQ
eukprot:365233-Chlamydomonas_euryale.AAC.3